MKVLLTGATGFVGSHILDALRARSIPTSILCRSTSSTRFIQSHLPAVDCRPGSLSDPASLRTALEGISHVIHCAGLTRALREEELLAANQRGTHHLIEAVNDRSPQIRRLVHISSLAAGHPATRAAPAKEDSPSAPVSAYGRTKLAAEEELLSRCRTAYTILRPSAVYGPRDREFLNLFRCVANGFVPLIAGGRQELSLVYAVDLARTVVTALDHAAAANRIFNVASPEIVTAGELTRSVAEAMQRPIRGLAVPRWALRLLCLAASGWAKVSRHPSILALGKYNELAADGWVCDISRLRDAVGVVCATPLVEGLRETLAWYRREGWLRGTTPEGP